MAYPRLPLEQRVEIIDAAVVAGLSPYEISQIHHIPEGQVISILREQGIPTGRRYGSSVADKFSAAQLDDIVADYKDFDMQVREVCQKWGLSHQQLLRLLDQLQIPRRINMSEYRLGSALRLQRAVQMYVDGAKMLEIYDETGVGSPTLYKELYQRKIPTRAQKIPRKLNRFVPR